MSYPHAVHASAEHGAARLDGDGTGERPDRSGAEPIVTTSEDGGTTDPGLGPEGYDT